MFLAIAAFSCDDEPILRGDGDDDDDPIVIPPPKTNAVPADTVAI